MSSGQVIETAFVELRVKLNTLETDMRTAQGKILASLTSLENQVTKKMAGSQMFAAGFKQFAQLAAFAFGSQMVRQALNYAGALKETADGLQITVEELQRMRFAFDQLGASAQTFDETFKQFNRRLDAARNGTGELRKFLKNNDIAFDESRSRVEIYLDTIAALEKSGATFAGAQKAFGRVGLSALPVIRQGTAAINEQVAAFRKLGLEISTDTAIKMDKLADQFKVVGASITKSIVDVLEVAGPLILWIADNATKGWSLWAQAVKWVGTEIGVVLNLLERDAVQQINGISDSIVTLQNDIDRLSFRQAIGDAEGMRQAMRDIRRDLAGARGAHDVELGWSWATKPEELSSEQLIATATSVIEQLEKQLPGLKVRLETDTKDAALKDAARKREELQKRIEMAQEQGITRQKIYNALLLQQLELEGKTEEAIRKRAQIEKEEIAAQTKSKEEGKPAPLSKEDAARLQALRDIIAEQEISRNQRRAEIDAAIQQKTVELERAEIAGDEVEAVRIRLQIRLLELDADTSLTRSERERTKEIEKQLSDMRRIEEIRKRDASRRDAQRGRSIESDQRTIGSLERDLEVLERKKGEARERGDLEMLERLRKEELRIREEIIDARAHMEKLALDKEYEDKIKAARDNKDSLLEIAREKLRDFKDIEDRAEDAKKTARATVTKEGEEDAENADTLPNRLKEDWEALGDTVAQELADWRREGEDTWRALGESFKNAFAKVVTRELVRLAQHFAELGINWVIGATGGAPPFKTAAAGDIVMRPERRLVGEAGPEAILPLPVLRGLAQRATGSAGPKTLVQVFNSTGEPVSVQRPQQQGGPGGFEVLKVMVGNIMVADLENGGPYSAALERRLGASRVGF